MTIAKQHITKASFKGEIVWDVRDAKSYGAGHIASAINMPFTKLKASDLTTIPTDKPIYVLCGGGTKAGKAVALLESFDSTRQYIELQGGTRAAKTAGFPIMVTQAYTDDDDDDDV